MMNFENFWDSRIVAFSLRRYEGNDISSLFMKFYEINSFCTKS